MRAKYFFISLYLSPYWRIIKATSRRIASIILSACSIAALLSCNLPSSWQKPKPEQVDYTVSIVEGDKTIDNGAKQTFTSKLSVSSLSGATYAWYVDDVKQEKETASTFSFSAAPQAEKAYAIKVIVAAGGASKEASVKCTVKAPVFAVSISEGDKTIDYGSSQTFTAKAANVPEGKTATYAWYVDDVEQAGCTKETFAFSATPTAEKACKIKVKAKAGDSTVEASVTCTVKAPYVPTLEEAQIAFVVYQGIYASLWMDPIPPTLKADKSSTGWKTIVLDYEDNLANSGYKASGWFNCLTENSGAKVTTTFELSLSGGKVKKMVTSGLTGAITETPAGKVTFNETEFSYNELVPMAASIKEGNKAIQMGASQTFTAEVSSLAQGASASYKWYVNGAVQAETSGTFSFTPSTSGDYSIKVVVTAGKASAEAQVSCKVSTPQ